MTASVRRSGSLQRLLLAAVSVGTALVAVFAVEPRGARDRSMAARLELAPGPRAEGFERVTAPRGFRLPDDHGPHFAFQTEWWYFTGQLATRDGARFGFQLTFFRRGLSPGAPPRDAGLATNQVYFAHFAITDASAGEHVAVERFSRGAAGLAGAQARPFAVWLEDWRVEQEPAAASPPGKTAAPPVRWRVSARDASAGSSLQLDLASLKPLALHGDRGVSPKSSEPGNASYYVGYTRLSARGWIGLGGRQAEAGGEAWFDHEWSTSALGPQAVGWDWFSLQLDDGRELMYFQIRRDDGGFEAASAGTLVARDGSTRRLGREQVRLSATRHWTSPGSGATYPAGWRLVVGAGELELAIEPLVADQELRTSFVYWEGAVRVSGTSRGRPITGQGYVELTGYGRSMQGVF